VSPDPPVVRAIAARGIEHVVDRDVGLGDQPGRRDVAGWRPARALAVELVDELPAFQQAELLIAGALRTARRVLEPVGLRNELAA
jgi:hypothetical protein